MLLFGADKRKGDEPKSSLRLRISTSLLLTFALLGYVAFEIYLIYIDGQDGFAVRTTVFTRETYMVPDVVFCSQTNPVLTFACDTILTDGTQVSGGCSILIPPSSVKYDLNLGASYDYCYNFRVNGQIIFDQWNESNKGVKMIRITVSIPTGQPPPDRITFHLFDPAGNFYAKRLIEGQFEDSVEIQAARVQNKYTLTSGTQLLAQFTTSLHQQLSKKDPIAILGFGSFSLTDQHFLSSSVDKVVTAGQQGIYSSVTIQPATYNTIIQQDQRRYTILTALGLLGGAYGAFASLFFFMFGEKQINPIGVLSRLWTPSQQQLSIDPYPSSQPMQQRNLLAGQLGTPNSQEHDRTLAGTARKSAEALEEGEVHRRPSQRQRLDFITTRSELSLEQRVKGIERLLNDYVVNLDQIGNNVLGEL